MRLKCTTSSLPSPQNSDKYEASAHVSIRQHTSAFVSIRQHSSAYVDIQPLPSPENSGKYAIRSETLSALVTTASASFYISIRQHTSRQREREREREVTTPLTKCDGGWMTTHRCCRPRASWAAFQTQAPTLPLQTHSLADTLWTAVQRLSLSSASPDIADDALPLSGGALSSSRELENNCPAYGTPYPY